MMMMLFQDDNLFFKEAAKSISFYKRLDETSKEVENEISKIKQQLDPGLEPVQQGGYGINTFVIYNLFS